MLKIKNVFKIKLLIVVLFLTSGSILAKDLDFSTSQPCNSIQQEYEINYDNAGNLEWIVEGGEIVAFANGHTPQNLSQSYMGEQTYNLGYNNNPFIDWLYTGNYTRYKFYGNSNVDATFLNPYTNQQMGAQNLLPNSTYNFNNPLKKVTIRWYQGYYGQRKIICNGKGLGFFGTESGTKEKIITFPPSIPNFSLTTTKTNPFCNESVQISGAPYGGTSYNWNTNGGVVPNGGNWNTGINISNFTRDGVVPISVTVSNQCYSVTKTITLNVTQPDFGHVTQYQNGNKIDVDVPGSLVSLDCQGKFNLDMPWVSNNAIYTWELPGAYYNDQTTIYDKTIVSGINKTNVNGQLPTGGLTDFVGKVTITGVCGVPVVRTFIIRPTLRPSVDADIYSCSNVAVINVNNPNAGSAIDPYVATVTPSGWAISFVNTTTKSIFTASNPGNYVVKINITDAKGCYVPLQTNVHIGSASGNTNAGTAGWQSGVLSDNRKAPGSNIVAYGGNVYFTGRDGKIYFYSFSTALQKWVINQLPGVTNAAIPASGAFTKIGLATIGSVSYLYYTENVTGKLWKIDLLTNVVSPGFSPSINTSDFITLGNDVYAIERGTNTLISNIPSTSLTLANATLKVIIPSYGIMYIQNNNLFSTWYGQLTYTGDVYSSSDIVYYNGFVYFARGQKGSANLYRVPMPNPNRIDQITTSSNLSGIFTINPASGVIYYGVMNSGAINTTYTNTSGVYKSANIYQAHLSGTTWIFNAATLVKPREELDMYIQSPVYSGNHVYYIGAGHNGVIGDGMELEVWNLYYENACEPALQRVAADEADLETASEVLLYPNPFNTELSIDLSTYAEDGNLTSVSIEVVDATGKSIYKSTVLSELTVISTADWAQGMYVVKINQNNSTVNKKVVKY